ncbi:MAG: hypothetical protein PQJ60_00470, partial [Spirochaetales bacterium]|nr:hypothetical protein [Spirochaetales bacterium]
MFGIYLFSLIFGFLVVIIDMFGILGDQDEGDEGEGDQADLNGDDQAVVMPDLNRGRWVYKALNVLRRFVYFCCGFGAVGVYGSLTENGFLNTLLYSVGTGLVLLAVVRLISRLQSRYTDSQLNNGDLLFAEAEVLVSIAPGKLGKVRVKTGGAYHDLFARGEDRERAYSRGSRVFVVDMTGSELVIGDK